MYIKTGDMVIVISGKESDQKGKVLKVLHKADRVVVEGRNLIKRHMKPNPMIGRAGGILEKEAPIHVSNVMLYSPNKKNKAGEVVGGGVRVKSRYVGADGSLFSSKAEAIKTYGTASAKVPKIRWAPETNERF